ncbi:hypothetical protein BU25DRAFT_105180 [Macroventuria anomochaeta]|uniref:Uncharacterized protein n=1 Tax=Macroventuria anomochaeta TaxID=301207 RepID=A0ACB6RVS1_9PLEO|nr:uncharacterized protein BU25DRAFT_105180 [Macroventuria anomochaeta]KAF2625878.1 hypothetical protein BU25DRAFT_105180 [Macroventuria anomochaeta]
MANEQDHIGRTGPAGMRTMQSTPSTIPPTMAAEEEVPADVDEPPEQGRTPRPAPLKIQHSSKGSFTKISKSTIDRKTSLLTSALQSASNTSSPVDDHSDRDPPRGMSCISTWSTSTISTADLTSDGGFTSPGTRTCTPSPPLPSTMIHTMLPPYTKKLSEQRITLIGQENDTVVAPKPAAPAGEQGVEATLGRKRCIMFACGGKKEEKKPVGAPAKPTTPASAEESLKRGCTIKFACAKPTTPTPAEEPPKRACTIKFACPTKVSTEAPSKPKTPRRAASPAPLPRRIPVSPKPSPRAHRDSDSTVRNNSPISVRKVSIVDRTRRLSQNSELAHTEAYRFHEFASSEEEVDEWTQEVTCHRNRLTVGDTLRVENNLRQLVKEVEEEALEDDEDEDDDAADDEDDDEDESEDEDNNSDAYSDVTDEGFQTDDEEGFAVSDESDAGSDYNWWAPGASTAATSIDHIGNLRPKNHRTVSESSIGSLESRKNGFKMFERTEGQRAEGPSGPSIKRKKSKPMNIRAPSPELPDSTDFVCGTLDEDRPAEEAYMSNLERRRAAKHKPAPQDIDPSFPASDPELVDDDEEDEVDDIENPSESDNYFVMHGRMDLIDGAPRGRRRDTLKQRSPPTHSPKRLRSPPPAKRAVHRSPPPPTKRAVHRSPPPPSKRSSHRSPPPRALFGKSPVRARSPAPVRLRSPPPSRHGSANILALRQRSEMSVKFGGIGERAALTVSASLPRTPITAHHNPLEYDDDEETSTNDWPVRRAIDIQIGLEKKRQRRREQLYRKQHRKSAKEKRPPPPGRGAERMRGIGLQMAAYKGKTTAFNPFHVPASPEQENMHVLSV